MGKVSCDCNKQSQEAIRRTYQAGQKEQRKRMCRSFLSALPFC